MKPESFETKLFISRDVEGNPNTQELEIIRDIEHVLSTHPAFVGIIPFGSIIRGYSNDDSDLDLKILYDPSKVPGRKMSQTLEEIESLSDIATKDLENKTSREVSLFVWAVNLELIRRGFESKHYPILEIANICRLVTGKNINVYRQEISRMFLEQPKDTQLNILSRVIVLLEGEEELSLSKLLARRPELNDRRKEILQARTTLWLHRVHDILYGNEDKN